MLSRTFSFAPLARRSTGLSLPSLFLYALLLTGIPMGYGQQPGSSITVAARVIDAETQEPIAYATVYHRPSGKGTVTSEAGDFLLQGIPSGDPIEVSFVGFQTLTFTAEPGFRGPVRLQPKAEMLSEVIVLSEDDYLYELVASLRKKRFQPKRNAKTYFSMESWSGDRQVELLECYYTGRLDAHNVTGLDLKNGRLALAEIDNSFFISTETSRAICMHRLFEANRYFPGSPFEFSKGKLSKLYRLELASRYKEDDGSVIDVVEFTPTDASRTLFSGKAWINTTTRRLVKVNLKRNATPLHPFLPHGQIDSLLQVDLRIAKTYTDVDGSNTLQSVDFDYHLDYRTRQRTRSSVDCRAVLYAYDFKNQFLPPFFEFTEGAYEDYRKINAVPYNDYFWEHMDEFRLNEQRERNDRFVAEEATITNQTLFRNNDFIIGKRGLFEHPYMFWDKGRVTFSKANDTLDYYNMREWLPSERYHLKAQIYLDINSFGDSIHTLTETVFDPFASFFFYPMTREAQVFINLYFDLVEIERQNLERTLRNTRRSKTAIVAAYQEANAEMLRITSSFLKEVERGTNTPALIRWNDRVKAELGIDNLGFFIPEGVVK